MKLWFERGAWASAKGRKRVAALSADNAESIALIRHAALGDMVLIRPFIFELRKFFPNATITLSLVSNYVYGAPEELVDRIHIIYGSDQRNVSKLLQYRKIKELGYHDIIFDMASPRSFKKLIGHISGHIHCSQDDGLLMAVRTTSHQQVIFLGKGAIRFHCIRIMPGVPAFDAIDFR